MEENESLRVNKAVLPFENREAGGTASDPYFQLRPELSKDIKIGWHFETSNPVEVEVDMIKEDTDQPDSTWSILFFNIQRLTGVRRLYLSSTVAPDVI